MQSSSHWIFCWKELDIGWFLLDLGGLGRFFHASARQYDDQVLCWATE
jgi:hypothetical protein